MQSKVTQISIAVIIVAIVILGGYYFFPRQEEQVDYFQFSVMSEDLSADKIERFATRFDEAKAALEENPDDFNAWLRLASAKKQVGDYKGAEDIWIHVGDIRPLNSTSFANLANLYTYFLIDFNKAEEAYFKAITNSANDEDNAVYYNNFYQFYLYQLKDFDKAEAILLEGIAKNPGRADLNATAGYFYLGRNNIQKAIEYFSKSLEFNPDNEQVQRELDKLQ